MRKFTKKEYSELAAAMARKGAKARAKAVSPERRTEIARNAAQTRWGKAKKQK